MFMSDVHMRLCTVYKKYLLVMRTKSTFEYFFFIRNCKKDSFKCT